MSDEVAPREMLQSAAASRRKSLSKVAAVAVLGGAILAGAAAAGHHWWTTGRFIQSTDDAYVGADVTPIAPHVAGFVRQVLVKDNQFVRAGQPLLRLDARDFDAALNHASATMQARQAALADLVAKRALQRSVIDGAAANLAAKQARAVFAAEDARRYRMLAATAAGTRQDQQRTVASDQEAKAAVLASQAALAADRQQLVVLDAEIAAAKAGLSEAEADLRLARLNVSYTVIVSPIAGYVGNRYAQAGTYVTAGTNLLSIVPASGLWVDANFKEDQLAQMKPGDPATIVADVLPGRVFHGHVASLAPATGAVFSVIPPQNATGNFTKIVQRVPVRIALEGAGRELGLLRAGLSTTVRVDTRETRK